MNNVFLGVIFLLLFSCRKEKFDIINLNGNKIIALGHAGMGIGNTYPMNSYESILKCLSLGTDGSEFDVQLTKDSVLVAYHDQELSNSTNLQGLIHSLSWEDVQKARYNQTPYLNYSVVSLEELFSGIGEQDLQRYKFTFDCKLYTHTYPVSQFYKSYIRAVIAIIQKYKLEDNVYIESQNVEFLSLFKSLQPRYKLFIYPPSFESGLDIALSLDLYGITISTHDISKEQIQTAHNKNLLIAVWNTHSETDNKEAIRKNPDFIQTDKVKNLVKLLK